MTRSRPRSKVVGMKGQAKEAAGGVHRGMRAPRRPQRARSGAHHEHHSAWALARLIVPADSQREEVMPQYMEFDALDGDAMVTGPAITVPMKRGVGETVFISLTRPLAQQLARILPGLVSTLASTTPEGAGHTSPVQSSLEVRPEAGRTILLVREHNGRRHRVTLTAEEAARLGRQLLASTAGGEGH